MNWIRRAACDGMDTNVFYPAKADHEGVEAAKAVCRRCPVRGECFEYALNQTGWDGDHGIWGGTTPEERKQIRKGRPLRCIDCGTTNLPATRLRCQSCQEQSAQRRREQVA